MPELEPDEVAIVLSLDPAFRSFALKHRSACLAQGIPFHFRSGYRPIAYQKVLHDHPELHPGTPAAEPGKSKHERAMAYDADHGNALQTVIFGQEAEKLGLTWGGRFQPKPDYAHVEAPQDLVTLDHYRALLAWTP